MGTTQPIREKKELEEFVDYYRIQRPNTRNYTLILFGLHTALRISDILNLLWEDVYSFEDSQFRSHLRLTERKTGKRNTVALNPRLVDALEIYRTQRMPRPEHYIFTKTTDHSVPLSRSQAFRIIKKAAEETLHRSNISCHSLRKTFGYYAWKQGTPPALLMEIYNHSSYAVTKKYLGIDQDERDSLFLEINFFTKIEKEG